MFRLLWLLAPVALAGAPRDDAATRQKQERAALVKRLRSACPSEQARLGQLEAATPTQRVELFSALEPCAGKDELFLLQQAGALSQVERFDDAEAVYRRALQVRVTEAAQLGLLTSLVRRRALTPEQQAELERTLDALRAHDCSRDDLCAGLSYVAWHQEDLALAKRAGERAIELKFPGWQPYFSAGTAYATGSEKERRRAAVLLREAKQRGGPAKAIDGFLAALKGDAGTP